MNKIVEEAARLGISLVGWVETGNRIARLLNTGGLFVIVYELDWEPGMDRFKVVYNGVIAAAGDLKECITHADTVSTKVGWAPAPIGYGLCEWQPIEAAPKDGTTILLWGGDYNTGLFGVEPMPRPMTGSYSTRHVKEGAWHLENSISGITLNPTHWMPLPAPPEVKG
jgi:hypothetical protein